MKTIIASIDQKDAILREIASQNNGIVKNVQVLTLNTLLKEEKDDVTVLSMQLSSLLNKQAEHFPIYQAMFSFPAFIQEILSFAKDCILYQITSSDLPETNANEEELKRIMEIALSLDFAEKKNIEKKEEIIHNTSSDITYHYQFISDAYHYDLFKRLSSSSPIDLYPKNTPNVEIKYALNARCEAEAIAQDICQRNTPCNVILSSSTSLPLYESVFERYNIPFSSLRSSKPLHLPAIFKTLVALGINKDRTSLLKAFRENAFEYPIDSETYSFFDNTLIDTSLPKDINGHLSEDIFERETKQYIDIYTKAKEYYESIQEDLDSLLSSTDPKDLLFKAFSIIRKSPYLKDKTELTSGIEIRRTIIECEPYISTNEDALFLARALENFKASEQVLESDFCTITDLTHPVQPKEVTYVVSVNGTNYPGVPKCTGLFDETYVEKVDQYPHQDTRYNMYMEQLSWVENSSTNQLIYSTYTNDYQGREIQLAFDIENKYHLPQTKWDLVSLEPEKLKEHTLDPELSKQLFLNDGMITGSVSTIERYFNCPYSYFIQSGLKIRKKESPALDARSIGTIQHKVFEDGVRDNGKKYADITEQQVLDYLDPAFQTLDVLHPTLTSFNKITKRRIVQGVLLACSFLKDFENNTSFVPSEVEYQFSEDITEHVHLNGIIDRLDKYNDEMIRIIDFKSSQKSLSVGKVKAGTQLQLLSYLMIAKKLFQAQPAGAYYFSLKEEKYDVIAKKASKPTKKNEGSITETDWSEEAEQTRMFNERRLSGWTFTDRSTEMDDSGTHIKKGKQQPDYDSVEQWILTIYDYFYEHVTNGEIELSPIEEACAFCNYKSICRFHGEKKKSHSFIKDKEEE